MIMIYGSQQDYDALSGGDRDWPGGLVAGSVHGGGRVHGVGFGKNPGGQSPGN